MIQEDRENNHSLPFIALTETWLKSNISDAQQYITGYAVTRLNRQKKQVLYCKQHKTLTVQKQYPNNDYT